MNYICYNYNKKKKLAQLIKTWVLLRSWEQKELNYNYTLGHQVEYVRQKFRQCENYDSLQYLSTLPCLPSFD
jgi:hypothetical protein